MKFSLKDFLSKCDQIRSILRIWSDLLKKSLTENFIFCAEYLANLSRCWASSLSLIYHLKYLKAFKNAYILFLPYMFCMKYDQAGGNQYFWKKQQLNLIFYQHFERKILSCKCYRVSMIIFKQFFVLVTDWYNTGYIITSISSLWKESNST